MVAIKGNNELLLTRMLPHSHLEEANRVTCCSDSSAVLNINRIKFDSEGALWLSGNRESESNKRLGIWKANISWASNQIQLAIDEKLYGAIGASESCKCEDSSRAGSAELLLVSCQTIGKTYLIETEDVDERQYELNLSSLSLDNVYGLQLECSSNQCAMVAENLVVSVPREIIIVKFSKSSGQSLTMDAVFYLNESPGTMTDV